MKRKSREGGKMEGLGLDVSGCVPEMGLHLPLSHPVWDHV